MIPMDDMHIIITTFKREDNQKAVAQIPEQLHHKVRMFTREDEFDNLRKKIPETIKIIPNPMDIDGIADIRQRCIDQVPKGKVWVIDDLCTFGWRDKDLKMHNEMDDIRWGKMYMKLSRLLEEYIQVGFSARGGNNFVTEPLKEIGRAYSTYGLRTDWMEENNIRFDGMYQQDKEVKLYEDYYITLAMLTKGLKNAIIYDNFFNYNHNSAGGNSTTRNPEMQERAAKALQKNFPQYVTLEKKSGKWGKVEGMEDRTEPRIQWARAYKEARPTGASLEDLFG